MHAPYTAKDAIAQLPTKQEAQLSQRDRAMLHVNEDLAKSLKITQDHSK